MVLDARRAQIFPRSGMTKYCKEGKASPNEADGSTGPFPKPQENAWESGRLTDSGELLTGE